MMNTKFKFYPRESRIYDFLMFPEIVYSSDNLAKDKDHNYRELIKEEYLRFIKKIEDQLKPYKKEIELFYMDDLSFIDLIFRFNSFDYNNEKEYLSMLLDLNPIEINRSMVCSMMILYENCTESKELIQKSEEIALNKDKLLKFIKDVPIEASAKWNIFCIVEEPVKYMEKYVELMMKLLPIFEELYRDCEEEVHRYGEYLVEFLNKNGAEELEKMTNAMLTAKMLDDEEINILISITSAYTIRINLETAVRYFVWGLKVEEAFAKIKELNENKMNERVQIFKNLGDKSRYEVLKLIALKQTSTKEIAKALGLSSATVSYHINNLSTSKIIKIDKSDNKYSYVVDYELLEESMRALKEDLIFPEEYNIIE